MPQPAQFTMPFSQALEGFWLARKRDLSPHTVRDYSIAFRRFQRYIHDVDLADITSQHIHNFLNTMQDKHNLSGKTLANYWIALSAFWTWAEHELGAPHLIRNKVARPKFRTKPRQPYTKDEVAAMLAACDQTAPYRNQYGQRIFGIRPTAHRDRAIIMVLVDCGLRAAELCALTLEDYNRQRQQLTVRHGKGDKQRLVYLGDRAARALWRYLATRPDAGETAPLFATQTGRHIDRNSLRQTLQRIAKRAGVPGANVHRFRHTFAVNFLRNRGNVVELQDLLGHESMDMVRIYARLASADLAAAQRTASPADNWGL